MLRAFRLSPLLLLLPLCLYGIALGWALLDEHYAQARMLELLPIGLLGIYLFFFYPWFTFWAAVFMIPLSINFMELPGGLAMSFPSEAVLWIFAAVLLFKLQWANWVDYRIFSHPVTGVILIQLVWILITSLTSSYMTASFKLLLARLIFLLVFFFFMGGVFRRFAHIRRFLWLWMLGALPVILIAFNRLSHMGFNRQFSPAMAEPWFSDHTVFSMCLSMLVPFFVLWFAHRRQLPLNRTGRIALTLILPLLMGAVLFSFSRASWLSLVLAVGLYVLLRFRISFPAIVAVAGLSIAAFYSFSDDLSNTTTRQSDKDVNTFVATVSSITDTERDESNLERLNRWACARRMFKERPFTGWGPGTYEFNYGSFQVSGETTRISTYRGDRGDAHSEYLTALSEQGLPGLFIFCLLILTLFSTGMRIIYKAHLPEVKIAATGILLGLFTFFFHGSVNSFLDIEKAASLVWAFAAMLVAMDVYHRHYQSPEKLDA